VDLYLRMAAAPTVSLYDLRAWTASGDETLSFVPPASGILHIGIYGYESSSYTVTTEEP